LSYWAVVQAEAQREHMARLLIMRHGFETYMPRIKHRNRIAPLFPTYVFVRIVGGWYTVLWTPHVTRILMAGDQPARLKEEIVTSIRKREVDGLVKLPLPNRLKPGQKVRITSGSFAGQIALYHGQSSRDRERVLLDLLGRQVPIDLPTHDLVAIPIASPKSLR
jgi:transcriptional antiterminator RfaH